MIGRTLFLLSLALACSFARNFISFNNYDDKFCKGDLDSVTIQPQGCFSTPSFTDNQKEETVTRYSCTRASGHSKITISQYHRNNTECAGAPKSYSTFLGNCTESAEAKCVDTFRASKETDTVYVQFGSDSKCGKESFQSFTIFYGIPSKCGNEECGQDVYGTYERMVCGKNFDYKKYIPDAPKPTTTKSFRDQFE